MPNSKILFREVQRMRQPLIWVILISATLIMIGVFGYGIVQQVVFGQPWGDRPMSDLGLLTSGVAGMAVMGGALVLLGFSRLITEVRRDGLFVRYIPFHWSPKKIALGNVRDAVAVTYRPLLHYGGWGIRIARGGRAYNAYGSRGVRLDFRNARHLLIGSQRPEELAEAIEQLRTARASE